MTENIIFRNLKFKRELVNVFVNIGDRILTFLSQIFYDKEYLWKGRATEVLGNLHTKKSSAAAAKLLKHEEPNLRIFALKLLAERKIPRYKDAALKALEDKNHRVQFNAVDILLELPVTLDAFNDDIIKKIVQVHISNNKAISGNSYNAFIKLGGKAVPFLAKVFKGKSINTQISAINILAIIGTKEAKEIIVEQAFSDKKETRESATSYALGIRHPKVKEMIDSALDAKDKEEIINHVFNFLNHGIHINNYTEKLIKILADSFLNTEGPLYEKVTNALSQKGKISLPLLKNKLKTKNKTRRLQIARIIFDMETKEADDVIARLTKDNDPNIRLFAIEALCRRAYPKLQEIVVPMIHDVDNRIKSKVFEIILHSLVADNFDKKLIRELVQTYLKKNDMNCARVTLLLKKLEEKAVPILIDELDNPDLNIRRFAADILGEITLASSKDISTIIKAKKATTKLLDMLQDSSVKVRRGAAYAIRSIKDNSIVDEMIRSLGDEDLYVRRNMITGLGNIKATKAIKPLEKMKKKIDNGITKELIEKALNNIHR